jgi:hypothetical protein
MLLFDRDLPGFGLRVGRGGSKTFIAQYTVATGKRRLPIGAFGLLTVEEARKRARAALGAVADGRDPFAEKQAITDAKKPRLPLRRSGPRRTAIHLGRWWKTGGLPATESAGRFIYIYIYTLFTREFGNPPG